ncbi:MAG: branched-chain amino acid transport system substrate-binding protein [Alphaproteobacteria bacterium]|nr:branched-chain amino acid transport system substrate-binding protein [Alphaproteobacteria bacterium]
MQSDPLKQPDFSALRFSTLVGRRGGVAAWNARAATATPLMQYLAARSPDAGSGVIPRLFGSLLLSAAMALSAAAQNAPGVTDHEIKIGQTMPYSGPGARFSVSGLAEKAYMQMINDQGGINGRKINLISVDDGFMPWRTGNETRKLIEVEHVAFIFGSIGTATQLSVAKYLNERKIPQLFIESGAYRWGRYKDTPYTIGGVRPSYRLGARLYVRHILKQDPTAKICILYEDNDYGRDYTAGARDVLGDKYAATVREATYGSTDASIDRQIVELKATGCNALIAATIPPLAVQAIRKVHDLGWKPIFFMNNVSASVPVILEPAGLESSVGLLSSAYGKDPRDPEFENDPAMKDWLAWMSKYLPDADVRRPGFVNGYNTAATMVQVLKQAGGDLSRENIMRQATNLRDLELPMLLPGVKVSTSPTDYYAVQQSQLMRFDGKRWVRFGDLVYDE